MRHRAASSFWGLYEKLPAGVKQTADRKYQLLKADPFHPSLQFKKVGELWSARVSRNYRALAHFDGEDYICIWIGTHSDYNNEI